MSSDTDQGGVFVQLPFKANMITYHEGRLLLSAVLVDCDLHDSLSVFILTDS